MPKGKKGASVNSHVTKNAKNKVTPDYNETQAKKTTSVGNPKNTSESETAPANRLVADVSTKTIRKDN